MKTPTILSLVSFAALGLPGPFQAAEVIHYWDFDTLEGDLPADVVGGVATSANGAPDVSTHPVYGEAYEGSGQSLNTAMGSADYLVADVLDPAGGGENALEFGAGSFSYSYWSWDASDLDGDVRGPRVFDCLNDTDVGIQLASNLAGIFNYRMDDALGSAIISNNLLGEIAQPDARWVHVAVNVDRENDRAEIYFDNVSQGSYLISDLEGDIGPGQDLQIGVINNGGTLGASQQCGLDDLAFYTGLLSEADREALAAGTKTPDQITAGPEVPFVITEVEVGDGSVSLTWNSEPGQAYAIDFSPDMRSWQELNDEHPSGGEQTTFQHTPGTARAFYQIRIPE